MNNRTAFLVAALLAPAISAHAAATSLTVQSRSLDSELASRAVVAAVADCVNRGYKVSAAVTGRDGNLLAFLRNPLSGPHTVLVSQRKAFTSATLQAATAQMQSRPDLSFAPGILLIQGGVPISVGGHFYGGIAVAGADPKDDEKCAEAGLAAISEALEFSE
ncbi:MAG: heme-binding protein [Pseudomonadota bacterium]|nr:MAG: heme-binding protein [Pseudomonadota bacterium]